MNENEALRIYISHVKADASTAIAIRDILELYAPERVEVFLSEDFINQAGWPHNFYEVLGVCDWMIILIANNSNDDLKWCFYEVGFFAGNKELKNRIIVLSSSDAEMPDPLKGHIMYRADRKGLAQFWIALFSEIPREGLKPLNPLLASRSDILTELSDKIFRSFSPQMMQQDYYLNKLTLFLNENQVKMLTRTGIVPDDALVKNSEQLFRIFGVDKNSVDKELHWGQLTANCNRRDHQSWLKALGESLKLAIQDIYIRPDFPLFSSEFDRKFYRPILYRHKQGSDESHDFDILFLEEASVGEFAAPRGISILLSLITFANRFQWMIINNYLRQLRILRQRNPRKKEIQEVLKHLSIEFMRIQIDMERGGVLFPNDVIEAFSNIEEKQKVERYFEAGARFAEKVYGGIEQEDLDLVYEALIDMRQMNKELLITALNRLQELFSLLDLSE